MIEGKLVLKDNGRYAIFHDSGDYEITSGDVIQVKID